MKREINKSMFLLLFILLLAALMTTVLAACDDGGSKTQRHEHTYTLIEAKAPTCTENGNIQYYSCSCGKYFDKDKNEIDLSKTVVVSTGHDKVAVSWESDGTSHWHKCNNCSEKFDLSSHTPADEWIEDSAATCTSKAHHHKECSACNYHTEEEDYGELGQHKWNAQNKCDVCAKSYEPLNEDKYDEREGKIYFGEYPQTRVQDSGTIATLSQMSGDTPSKGNKGKWTDYGYYLEGKVEEYMWCIDLEYSGAKYRGVYFISYKPGNIPDAVKISSHYGQQSVLNSFQDDFGFSLQTLYWFKWEPIEWRILEKGYGEVFLMSNLLLDARHFYNNRSERTIDGKTVYANNYKESDIRAWLNGYFYDAAFDSLQKSIIKTTLVDNSAKTTSDSNNEYFCEDTEDKVFLLSCKDIDGNYGFEGRDKDDPTKKLGTTDYAKIQGVNERMWWLRSPCYADGETVQNVWSGFFSSYTGVDRSSNGVVPAIKIEQ